MHSENGFSFFSFIFFSPPSELPDVISAGAVHRGGVLPPMAPLTDTPLGMEGWGLPASHNCQTYTSGSLWLRQLGSRESGLVVWWQSNVHKHVMPDSCHHLSASNAHIRSCLVISHFDSKNFFIRPYKKITCLSSEEKFLMGREGIHYYFLSSTKSNNIHETQVQVCLWICLQETQSE